MKNLVFSLFLLFPFFCAVSQHSHSFHPPGPATRWAVQDGNWQNASTWNGGTLPANGDIVEIPVGRKVTLRHLNPARIKFLHVKGVFRIGIFESAELKVETILVEDSGTFQVGNPSNRMANDKVATVTFIADSAANERTWDHEALSGGLISKGKVRIYGKEVQHMSIMNNSIWKKRRI